MSVQNPSIAAQPRVDPDFQAVLLFSLLGLIVSLLLLISTPMADAPMFPG